MSFRWCIIPLFVLLGCARPIFIPSGTKPLTSAESSAMVQALSAGLPDAKELRGLYRVRREEDGRSTTLRAAIQLTSEGRVLIETFPLTSFIALHTLTLTATGSSFEDHTTGQRITLESEEELLRKLFGVALRRPDLLAILHGQLPSIEEWSASRAADGSVVLRSSNAQWIAKLVGDGTQVEALELRDPLRQQARLQVQYEREAPNAGLKELALFLPRVGVRLRLSRLR